MRLVKEALEAHVAAKAAEEKIEGPLDSEVEGGLKRRHT